MNKFIKYGLLVLAVFAAAVALLFFKDEQPEKKIPVKKDLQTADDVRKAFEQADDELKKKIVDQLNADGVTVVGINDKPAQ